MFEFRKPAPTIPSWIDAVSLLRFFCCLRLLYQRNIYYTNILIYTICILYINALCMFVALVTFTRQSHCSPKDIQASDYCNAILSNILIISRASKHLWSVNLVSEWIEGRCLPVMMKVLKRSMPFIRDSVKKVTWKIIFAQHAVHHLQLHRY